MLSFIARLALTATSLAPMLLTYSFAYYSINKWVAGAFLVIGLLLLALCKLLLYLSTKMIQDEPVRLKSVKIADQHVVWFVAAYLYPIVYSQLTTVRLSVLAVVLITLVVVVYNSRAFNFNPVLNMFFRYHFYEVITEREFTYVVVSKRRIVNTRVPIVGKQLSPYMYLDAEG